MRTFVAVTGAGQFQHAATDLGITQQAVSKRIAALEKELGVRLFTRTGRGIALSIDGQAFLPHAQELLRIAERAVASVRPGRRALRVDVINRRIAPAALLRDFHAAHPGVELDLLALGTSSAAEAVDAVLAGTIDATFRRVTPRRLPAGIEARRVLDEPHELLVGPSHELASVAGVRLAELAKHRIWIPGILPGTEWAAYFAELAAAFRLEIDAIGPNFGTVPLFEVLAESSEFASLVGNRSRLTWPERYDLRRIPVRDPTPVYPLWLVWHRENAHPGLPDLLRFLPPVAPCSDSWSGV